MSRQLFLSFMKDSPPPSSRAGRRAARRAAEIERQAMRSRNAKRIKAIVEIVAASRGVDWQPLFQQGRGLGPIASARVLAIGLCCAMDVPQYIVARAFRRSWATIFCAEIRCSKLYKSDAAFRREWDRLAKSIQNTP